MARLLPLFIDNILPIFLAAGAGYVLARTIGVAARPISQVSFYIFSPALLFKLLTSSSLTGSDILRMSSFTIATTLAIGIAAWLVARLLKLDRRMTAALMLLAMFSNSGNYGLTLNLFAFGESGLTQASMYFASLVILTYTLGIVVASTGHSSFKKALISLLRVPAVYAMILALFVNMFQVKLPVALDRTVSTLSSAAIPMLLVVMGVQLQHANWQGRAIPISAAVGLRLVAAPLLAIAVAPFFALQGVAFQAAVTESAMPTAVLMTVLATEYNVEPTFVTAAVMTSTILSPITLTPLLAFLGA